MKYGPQQPQVWELLAALRRCTPEQIAAVAAADQSRIDEAADRAWAATVADPATWDWTKAAARVTADDAWDAALSEGWPKPAARLAAAAGLGLATRHLVGRAGYTQEDYTALVWPAATVLGPVHPDDQENS